MARNSAATKRSIARAGDKKKPVVKNVHVVPNNQGWAIRSEGSSRASSRHETQREAVEVGRMIAKKNATTLVIHSRDGRVKTWDSYRRDPIPPREPREVLYPIAKPRTASRNAIKKAVSEAIRQTANKQS